MVINQTDQSPKKKVNLNLSDETKSFQERIDEVRSLVEENLRYTKSIKQSKQQQDSKIQKELQKLLQDNLKISKELYEMTKKIRRWTVWQRVWGILKILVIVVPLALGLIYLPPLVRQGIEPIQKLYQEFSSLIQDTQQQPLNQQIIDQLQEDEAIPE